MTVPFHEKQAQFIAEANTKYNLAHGAVSTGKTVCTLFKFLQMAFKCPGDSIFVLGYSLGTIWRNVITLLFEAPELNYFAPFCKWSKSDSTLFFGYKRIKCIGAGGGGR